MYEWLVPPRGRVENLEFRSWVLQRAASTIHGQVALLKRCREDRLFWINTFVWQYNPNAIGDWSAQRGPFVTWEAQEEAFRKTEECIRTHRDAAWEKSRQQGASWLCMLLLDGMLLFEPWSKSLVISRGQEAVDRPGDPDSLFWKLDYVHEHLPWWMVGPNGSWIKRQKMGFRHLEGHSTVTGQASTGRAGVGGVATVMFIDEFPEIVEDWRVLYKTSDTTSCRIFNGTHKGTGSAFVKVIEDARLGLSRTEVIQLHWSQHPDKRRGLYRYDEGRGVVEVLDKTYHYPADFVFQMVSKPAGGPFPGVRSPWYDEQCGRKPSDRAIAEDLDIDAAGSVTQFFNAQTIRQLIGEQGREPVWTGDLNYDREAARPLGLHRVDGGPLRLWRSPKVDGTMPAGPYALGADLSLGLGATNSCISIAQAQLGEKVGEYITPSVKPDELAVIAVALCWLFKDEEGEPAKLVWEKNGPGGIFGQRIDELKFRNIFMRPTNLLHTGTAGKLVSGWHNRPDLLLTLLGDYRTALESRQLVNRSVPALKECLEYRLDKEGKLGHPLDIAGDDPTGARANHGDRVIADALAWMMSKTGGLRQALAAAEEVAVVGSLAWRRSLPSGVEEAMNESWERTIGIGGGGRFW